MRKKKFYNNNKFEGFSVVLLILPIVNIPFKGLRVNKYYKFDFYPFFGSVCSSNFTDTHLYVVYLLAWKLFTGVEILDNFMIIVTRGVWNDYIILCVSEDFCIDFWFYAPLWAMNIFEKLLCFSDKQTEI